MVTKKTSIFAKKKERPEQKIKRLKQSIRDSSEKIARLQQVKQSAREQIKEICSTIPKKSKSKKR